MHGYKENIEKLVVENNDFRRVLYTGKHSQLVAMTLQTGEEIGVEVHPENDQFFRFESGEGKVLIDGNEYVVTDGDVTIVPAGAEHNIINASTTVSLKLYTIYSPAHHRDGVIHTTKAVALADEEEFDGQTTE